MLPKVTINYELEYKGRFSVDVERFEGMSEAEIVQEVEDRAAGDWLANACQSFDNMPAIIAEITEGLKLLAVQRAEEESQ